MQQVDRLVYVNNGLALRASAKEKNISYRILEWYSLYLKSNKIDLQLELPEKCFGDYSMRYLFVF